MARIVIVMDGGLIQDVLSDEPVEYCTIDYDAESVEQDQLTKIPQLNAEPEDAFAYHSNADVMPERVAELFVAVLA